MAGSAQASGAAPPEFMNPPWVQSLLDLPQQGHAAGPEFAFEIRPPHPADPVWCEGLPPWRSVASMIRRQASR